MNSAVLSEITALVTAAGFVEDPTHPQYTLVEELSQNGPHSVNAAWRNDSTGTLIHIEENASPEPVNEAGGTQLVIHPSVLVAQKANGNRITVNTHDMPAVTSVINGELDF